MRYLLPILCIIMLATTGHAKRLPERYYQAAWCNAYGYTMEYMLPDGCRCDCLSLSHVIEVDFAAKYHEALGQALDYMEQTGKRGGILLIVEKSSDLRYYRKLVRLIDTYSLDIDVWLISEVDETSDH